MPRLDIWSHASGNMFRDTLSSLLANLVLAGHDTQSAYFSSPWISDFPIFRNDYGQYTALFSEFSDNSEILFSQYLTVLSQVRPIRVITVRNATSQLFSSAPAFRNDSRVQIRYAPESYHEKGILSPLFYVQGSMNLTYSGLFVRDEKVSVHTGPDHSECELIGRAYLEFGRRWDQLAT